MLRLIWFLIALSLTVNGLHSQSASVVFETASIGYITPKDMLAGRQQEIHAERDRKLEDARTQRQIRRQQAA
jgi:hypothetical protein